MLPSISSSMLLTLYAAIYKHLYDAYSLCCHLWASLCCLLSMLSSIGISMMLTLYAAIYRQLYDAYSLCCHLWAALWCLLSMLSSIGISMMLTLYAAIYRHLYDAYSLCCHLWASLCCLLSMLPSIGIFSWTIILSRSVEDYTPFAARLSPQWSVYKSIIWCVVCKCTWLWYELRKLAGSLVLSHMWANWFNPQTTITNDLTPKPP